MGVAVRAIVLTIKAAARAVDELEKSLTAALSDHTDAKIAATLPALGGVLIGRILGEFGDDPRRFATAADRRAYAGTAPVTRSSGKSRVVAMRRARNTRLAAACRWWAFLTLAHSPEARAYYNRCRAAGTQHETAMRKLASKLITQLHYCLERRVPYDPARAWTASG